MKEFDELLEIADRLLSPTGCPWDREQTIFTLQPFLLEEVHELIQAIDLEDCEKILEELGDVFYSLIFIAKLKEDAFTLAEVFSAVSSKLIRRHPHVFGNEKINSSEEIVQNWEKIKKEEGKKNPISDIPPTLPSLARAQKIVHKMRRLKDQTVEEKNSDDIGQEFWELIKKADSLGIDAEGALRKKCHEYEEKIEKRRR